MIFLVIKVLKLEVVLSETNKRMEGNHHVSCIDCVVFNVCLVCLLGQAIL